MNPHIDASSDHDFFAEHAIAYIAGGLDEGDARRLEAHVAACPTCAARLGELQRDDAAVREVFADVVPPADFEERVVTRFRAASRRLRLPHPLVRRIAIAVAATMVVGTCGYVASQVFQERPNYEAKSRITYMADASTISMGQSLSASPSTRPTSPVNGENVAVFNDRLGDTSNWPDISYPKDDSGKMFYMTDPTLGRESTVLNGGTLTISGQTTPSTPPMNPSFEGGDASWLSTGNASITGERNTHEKSTVTAGGLVATNHREMKELDRVVSDEKSKMASTLTTNEEIQKISHDFTKMSKEDLPTLLVSERPQIGYVATKTNNRYLEEFTRQTSKLSDEDAKLGSAHERTVVTVMGKPEIQKTEGRESTVLVSGGRDGEFGVADDIANDGAVNVNSSSPKVLKVMDLVQNAPEFATPPSFGPPASAVSPAPAPQAPVNPNIRHIIRNGEMQFEVDNFDSAALQVSKIVGEEGGYIDTTNSEKLANGKVQGTVVVRVPPDHLDVLILKLRGIGDLKSQHIAAQDITKEYTDLESRLNAAKTMEERLLDIVKRGNGEVKDLVEAEKQLGVEREKIETYEGQIRYYNSLISLSTLNVGLTERDIRAAYAATESETVSAGVETEDVEKSRDQALKAIEEIKGRVIESNLNKVGSQQFKGTIVAEVPADKAGSLIDSLKQIGKVARLDIQRKQTAEGGAIPAAMAASLKVERKQTRFDITLYNLAEIAPRQTINVTLACPDVREAYEAIVAYASQPGQGRVLSSNLSAQGGGQVGGTVVLEVRSQLVGQFESTLNNPALQRVQMNRQATENPDSTNITSAKVGYAVTLTPLALVPPRESRDIAVAARDVAGLYHAILTSLQDDKHFGARVIDAQLSEQDPLRVSGVLDFEIARAAAGDLDKLMVQPNQSEIVGSGVTRSSDEQNTVDSKLHVTLRLINSDNLKPRETTQAQVEVGDVEQASAAISAAAQSAGGKTVERRLLKQQGGAMEMQLTLDVPLSTASQIADALRGAGNIRQLTSSKNLQIPDGPLARAEFDLTLGNADLLIAPSDSISGRFHNALSTSVKGLLLVLQCLVVGLILIVPAAVVLWGGWRFVRRGKHRSAANVRV